MQETIIFTGASGTHQIDFTQNGRIDKFGSDFQIEAYNVNNVEGVTEEVKIQGLGVSKTCFGSLVTAVTLGAIFNNGYIKIISKDEKVIINSGCTINA